MKYMRNYATEGAFTADKTIMDSIESDKKIWFSYIKDPKSVKINYRERPMYDHNAIEANPETLTWMGGDLKFDVYLTEPLEPQSQLSLHLPWEYDALYQELDQVTITPHPNSTLNYKITLPTPIAEITYNNDIPYPFYISVDNGETVLASCTVTQTGKPYNKIITPGYIRGTVFGLPTDGGNEIQTVIGAGVVIKGESTWAQTGMDGKFSIQIRGGGNVSIEISYLEYQTLTMPASTENELSILLIPDTTTIG